uniref:cytoplasmic protein n=1 Tax=uncultured Sphingomonas sp. TaxID=158754 RepID=UPI0035C9A5B5
MSFASEHERTKAYARANGRAYLLDAHTHTVRHRAELEASSHAGCFYCCAVFPPAEIEDWVDNDDCALCPRCGIDAVIGDASGFAVADKKFLKEMNEFWF